MIKKIILYIWSIVAILFTSCSDEFVNMNSDIVSRGTVSVDFAQYMVNGKTETLSGENKIDDIKACLFVNGIFTSTYDIIKADSEDYKFNVDKKEGTLYVVANGQKYGVWDSMKQHETKEVDWLNYVVEAKSQTEMFFTGTVNLKATDASPIKLTLKRGLSRFDIKGLSESLKLKEIKVSGIADRVYFFPKESISLPEASSTTRDLYFTESLLEDKKGILYLHEQPNNNIEIQLKLNVNGEDKIVSTKLHNVKEIKRNTVYTLQLSSSGEINVSIKVDEWGNDDTTVGSPEFKSSIKINKEESFIPGVDVADDNKKLIFSHHASESILTLSCDNELELSSYNRGIVYIENFVDESGIKHKNKFKVKKKLLPPGAKEAPIEVLFKRKGLNNVYGGDKITLEFKTNPNKITGDLQFDHITATCNFDTYVENEVGIIEVEEGKEVITSVGSDKGLWIIAKPVDGDPCKYRIVAGWKPNDPTANGQIQTANIIIQDKETEKRSSALSEVYTVTRKNYGLPVVKLNEVWWCKYNAMGNSKLFEDQILCGEDPAYDKNLYDYLKSCPQDDFLKLWNSSYKGESGQALTVSHDGTKFVLGEWYNETVNINTVDPKAIAPYGYEMPEFGDYKRLFRQVSIPEGSWAEYTPENPNSSEYNVHIRREYRKGLKFSGKELPEQMMIIIESTKNKGDGPLVFYGVGRQSNLNEGIIHTDLLLASKWPDNSTQWGWGFENKGANLKTHSYGPNNMRILRFKKSPVEYIYE